MPTLRAALARRAMASLAALASAACGAAAPEVAPASAAQSADASARPIGIRDDYVASRYVIPRSVGVATDLAVCPDGPVAVVGGGVYDPLRARWLLPAQTPPVDHAECDDAGRLITIAGSALTRHEGGRSRVLGELPGRGFRLAWSGRSLLTWGRAAGGELTVLEWEPRHTAATLWSGPDALGPGSPAGPHALVTTMGEHVTVVTGAEPAPLRIAAAGVDGIAVDADGSLYVSSPKGIERHRGDGEDPADLVATSLHGPLRARLGTLFVLVPEASALVRLAPKGEAK